MQKTIEGKYVVHVDAPGRVVPGAARITARRFGQAMLSQAIAKCLAQVDQRGASDAQARAFMGLPQSVGLPDENQTAALDELKGGVTVTKLSWRGPYERTVQLEDRCIVTLDPVDKRVTNRWDLTDIAAVRIPVRTSFSDDESSMVVLLLATFMRPSTRTLSPVPISHPPHFFLLPCHLTDAP